MITARLKAIANEPVFQIAFFVFLFQAIFVSPHSYMWDMKGFQHWCINISQHGISYAYNIGGDLMFNYPPLICYPLFVLGKLAGSEETIYRYFYLSKVFPLLFDFIAAMLIVHLAADNKRKVLYFLLLVVNPAFIYNSYCWGQYDSVLATLIFIAFYFLLERKLLWAVVFVVLAINFKPQSVIFLPPLFLYGAYMLWNDLNLKKVFQALGTGVVVQVVILLPFILAGNLGAVVNTVIGAVDFYPVLSTDASNFWYLLFGQSVNEVSDQEVRLGVTYKNWGLLLFCTASFFALFPLFASLLSKVFGKRQIQIPLSQVFISFALIPLVFFFFCTQMHSRYVHPSLIFIALFAFTERKWLPFVLVCLVYLTSLEVVVQAFNYTNYRILFFDSYFIASLYAVVIILLFYYLYKSFTPILKKQFHERELT